MNAYNEALKRALDSAYKREQQLESAAITSSILAFAVGVFVGAGLVLIMVRG